MGNSEYRCAVFDFDGTIANSFDAGMHIIQELSEEYGFRQIDLQDWDRIRAMSTYQFLRYLKIPRRRLPKILRAGMEKLAAKIDEVPPIEGILEAIEVIRTRVEYIGVLTSNSVENVRRFEEMQGKGRLFDFVSSVGNLMGKAKSLNAIRITFSVTPEQTIYIGDEVRDIKAARKAKVPSIGVGWGFNSIPRLEKAGASYTVGKAEELLEIF